MILMCWTDKLLYFIAFKLAGGIGASIDADKEQMSGLHWGIRLGLLALVWLITRIPLCTAFVTALVHFITSQCIIWFEQIRDELIERLIPKI